MQTSKKAAQPIGGTVLMNGFRGAFVVFALSLAAGCSSMDGGHNDRPGGGLSRSEQSAIKIDSEPPGADVFAMGEKIGATPLVISFKEIFPSTYPKEKESYYGKVTFRKAGCSDLTRAVSTKLIVLRGELECESPKITEQESPKTASDADATAEQKRIKSKDLLDKEQSIVPANPERSRDAVDTGASAEQRLIRIKELLDKGLITEEEAKRARERVINGL